MNELYFLQHLAKQAIAKDKLLNVIAHEQPVDQTHYAQTEAERNLLWDLGKAFENTYKLDPGTFEREVGYLKQCHCKPL